MRPVTLGLIGGLAFGTVDVLLMLPLEFPDKRTALAAAFASRFAIGFLVPLCKLPVPWTLSGAIVGLLISVPDAIVTRAYIPILASGIIGGAVLGWVRSRATV